MSRPREIPTNAFELYAAMGENRSFQRLADQFDVSKQSVAAMAARERWKERLDAMERRLQQESDRRAELALSQTRERQLRTARAIQAVGLEALRQFKPRNVMQAVRMIDIGFKQERLLQGQSTEQMGVTVESIIRKEYERWMTAADTPVVLPNGESNGHALLEAGDLARVVGDVEMQDEGRVEVVDEDAATDAT